MSLEDKMYLRQLRKEEPRYSDAVFRNLVEILGSIQKKTNQLLKEKTITAF